MGQLVPLYTSASKWKKPADMGKVGSDPSKQSLQNRKRDQDAILVRGSAAVVLSLRFVSGNQVRSRLLGLLIG